VQHAEVRAIVAHASKLPLLVAIAKREGMPAQLEGGIIYWGADPAAGGMDAALQVHDGQHVMSSPDTHSFPCDLSVVQANSWACQFACMLAF
jgi:hypothetical protein